MDKKKQRKVPKHVENLLLTNFLDYFTVLSHDTQVENIDYAIKFVKEYLKRNEGFTTDEQEEFVTRLQEFKVDCAYEKRYDIQGRINSERRKVPYRLMKDMEEDYLNCEFLSTTQLYEYSDFNSSKSKYGTGLARFASIILARERARVRVTGKGKGKLKVIEQIEDGLLGRCSELKETFAHEERSLKKILLEQCNEDLLNAQAISEEQLFKGLDDGERE